MNLKDKKHIWLPILLGIYFLFMAYMGRDILLVEKQYARYFITCGAEILILIALVMFLKKKRKLRLDRNDLKHRTDELISSAEEQQASKD